MGDRVSIQFKNENQGGLSVVLFSHWGGEQFPVEALEYAKNISTGSHCSTPLSRLEPNTVMVDFIREITKDLDVCDSNLYLAKDEHSGDNSDQGHYIINLNTFELEHEEDD